MKLSKRTLFIIVLIVVNIALDQASKIWVRASVEKGSQTEIIGNFFTLHNVENDGAFLGMGSDLNPTLKLIFLLIIPIIVLGFVVHYILKDKSLDRFSLIAFSSIVGGGLANVYDRFAYGSVTDFFHINFGGMLRTGIFNVADMSVTFGMIILVIVSLKKKKHTEDNNIEKETAD